MGTKTRYLNIILGIWLFISAFLWPHSGPQFTNTWLMGLLCIVFSFASMMAPAARYLNVALAIWLFISAFALPRVSTVTVWNNSLVGIAILVLSLVSTGPE